MFRDREDAGRRLAERLLGRDLHDPLVLAIPRGGVVVGAVIAKALAAEFDVILSRKLRAPWQPELAVGAVTEDGQAILTDSAHTGAGVTKAYLIEECRQQRAEIEGRRALLRAIRPRAVISGRSVIVTDDGIATGSTLMAALEVVSAQAPHEIVAAVPVGPTAQLDAIRAHGADVECLLSPDDFRAVGQVYERFEEVSDAHVIELLRDLAPDPC